MSGIVRHSTLPDCLRRRIASSLAAGATAIQRSSASGPSGASRSVSGARPAPRLSTAAPGECAAVGEIGAHRVPALPHRSAKRRIDDHVVDDVARRLGLDQRVGRVVPAHHEGFDDIVRVRFRLAPLAAPDHRVGPQQASELVTAKNFNDETPAAVARLSAIAAQQVDQATRRARGRGRVPHIEDEPVELARRLADDGFRPKDFGLHVFTSALAFREARRRLHATVGVPKASFAVAPVTGSNDAAELSGGSGFGSPSISGPRGTRSP